MRNKIMMKMSATALVLTLISSSLLASRVEEGTLSDDRTRVFFRGKSYGASEVELEPAFTILADTADFERNTIEAVGFTIVKVKDREITFPLAGSSERKEGSLRRISLGARATTIAEKRLTDIVEHMPYGAGVRFAGPLPKRYIIEVIEQTIVPRSAEVFFGDRACGKIARPLIERRGYTETLDEASFRRQFMNRDGRWVWMR